MKSFRYLFFLLLGGLKSGCSSDNELINGSESNFIESDVEWVSAKLADEHPLISPPSNKKNKYLKLFIIYFYLIDLPIRIPIYLTGRNKLFIYVFTIQGFVQIRAAVFHFNESPRVYHIVGSRIHDKGAD